MKTEDQIAREKDAVQKMVGAKAAMDAALTRIDRLQKALDMVNLIMSDIQGNVGENLYVKTYRHGGSAGEQVVSLKNQIAHAKRIIEDVR